jgi:hypothetical protein
MTTSIRVSCRSGPKPHGTSQTRQPTAIADLTLFALCHREAPVSAPVKGQLLRNHTLRSRPAYMRVAVARSTIGWRVWQARAHAHPHRPPRGVAAASRRQEPFVLGYACGRCVLDPRTRRLLNQRTAPRTSGPARPKIISNEPRDPLDTPFHMRTTTHLVTNRIWKGANFCAGIGDESGGCSQ